VRHDNDRAHDRGLSRRGFISNLARKTLIDLETRQRIPRQIAKRGVTGTKVVKGKFETIYPGDVFASGTMDGGCSLERGRWLNVGDTIEMTAEGIGCLRNRVFSDSSMV
jgi:hypothetical protein